MKFAVSVVNFSFLKKTLFVQQIVNLVSWEGMKLISFPPNIFLHLLTL